MIKTNAKHCLKWGLTMSFVLLWGCTTETVDSSTLVCTPGIRQCDDTSTRILECHPNGAAWEIVSYCSAGGFCVNGACTGEGAAGFEGALGNQQGSSSSEESPSKPDAEVEESSEGEDGSDGPDVEEATEDFSGEESAEADGPTSENSEQNNGDEGASGEPGCYSGPPDHQCDCEVTQEECEGIWTDECACDGSNGGDNPSDDDTETSASDEKSVMRMTTQTTAMMIDATA